MLINKIKTILNSVQIFTIFRDKPYSFFLDSGMDHKKLGRYSFIGYSPFLVLKSKGEEIRIYKEGSSKATVSYGDIFDKLKEVLDAYKMNYQTEFPFIGGAVGFLGYDLCNHLEKLPRTAVDDINVSDCYFGFYDGVIIIDHEKDEVLIASLGMKGCAEKIVADIEQCIKEGEEKCSDMPVSVTNSSKLVSNLSKEEYITAIDKIKNYIKSGDVYQVNMTQRYECATKIEPFELYKKLRFINPAPFASFIDFGEGQIVSSSPERFIRIKDRSIETRPIKGTCPRGDTLDEDTRYKHNLLSSKKDKAELLMIVDLERNDFGKIAKTGTVKVNELFGLETYPTVHHLVATVAGEISDEYDVVDCIKATFPGGSITGAPKIRAMEIIDELEPTARNIYTGSIGYIGFNGNTDLNIVIRTILCKDGKAYFQVGSGIVWDSNGENEYQETLDKAKALIQVLEN